MGGVFYLCRSLKSLPDISKWNTQNVLDISGLFFHCSSLQFIPDISNWNLENVIYLSFLFFNCSSLIELPDISKWNVFINKSNTNNKKQKLYSDLIDDREDKVIHALEVYNDLYI